MSIRRRLPGHVDQTISEAINALQIAMENLYLSGLEAGEANAEALKKQMAAVIGATQMGPVQPVIRPPVRTKLSAGAHKGQKTKRAPLGSVRPAITNVLRSAPGRGLDEKTIYQRLQEGGHTAIKEATVRSTLNKMRAENRTLKNGKLWTLREESLS